MKAAFGKSLRICVRGDESQSAVSLCRRFPKSRVWPPLPSEARTPTRSEGDTSIRLPPQDVQERLLQLYFAYVHAQLPILHKSTFMDMFRQG